jgi:hypothetical protein
MAEEDKKPAVGAKEEQLQPIWGKAISSVEVTLHEQCGGDQGRHVQCGWFKRSSKVQQNSLKSIKTCIQRTYKMPDDIVKAIQNMIRPSFDPPEKPDKSKCLDNAGKFDPDKFRMAKFTWKEDWKLMNSRKQKYKENEANAWALVYNQCSNELRVKLEGTSGYKLCKKENNVIALLTMISGYCCQFDALKDEYVAIVAAIKGKRLYCPACSLSCMQI